MQMPQWLFFDPKYIRLSLETKVSYTFLLNRFQLSRMNGWVNGDGEVFIIYPREKLAEEIGISYRKAIQCFRELAVAGLIWEHRVGRGAANRIYMAAVELSEDAARRLNTPDEPRSVETVCLEDSREPLILENCPDTCEILDEILDFDASAQERKEPPVKECNRCSSRPAETAYPGVQFRHSIKTEEKKIEYRILRKSVRPVPRIRARGGGTDRRTAKRICFCWMSFWTTASCTSCRRRNPASSATPLPACSTPTASAWAPPSCPALSSAPT
jgi:hypothetical protein